MVATLSLSKPGITSKDEVIAFTTSVTISTFALLAPLSFFALSIALSTMHQNEYETEGTRFLQQDSCINATATDDSTLTTTWDAVKLTSIVATSVALLCAIGYESFRRDPIVGKYVYDRKRLKDPDRTPPPLMLSRSLWTGCPDSANDNDKNKSTTCWKVPPAFLELIFVNLDHKYIRYSKAADDARKKREELGHYTCCRKGWYHNCCFCSKRKLNKGNDDVFVDDDGYEYFQGHDYTLEEEVIAKKFDTQWSKTIDDLFPRDSVSHFVGDIEEHCDVDSESFNTAADSEHLSIQPDDETRAGQSHSCLLKSSEDESSKSVGSKKIAYPYRLVYLFMPPGFHVWKDAIPYISHFFWFPAIARRFNLLFRRSKMYVRDNDISLTEPEQELLHFVGLDIYLLIRFARLGFDICYYPFLVSCITVLPVYSSAAAEGSSRNRYFSNSINNIQNGSNLIWVAVVFSVAFFLYVLRRLWVEWEVFIQLRHDFLANGAQHFHSNNLVKEKYRKTCIVECVPVEYRSDRVLYDTFNKLFPNQIARAEMLVDTSKLEALVNERKDLIVRLENMDSLDRWKNRGTEPNNANASNERVITKLCCRETHDKAMCETKLLEINGMVDAEYSALVEKRSKFCNASNVICQPDSTRDSGLFSFNTIYQLFPSQVRALIRSSNQFSSSCGIVEFKTFAAKQWAVQCNLADEPYWMLTNDAPDPRDLIWPNMCMDYKTIEYRESISEFVLLVGLAGWGVIVTWITSLSHVVATGVGLPQVEYLQSLLVFLVLLWLPAVFMRIAERVIRFKSLSRVDEFVMKWSTAYRIANIFFVFFNINLVDTVRCFSESPQKIWLVLSTGIVRQSAFLINLVIQAAGQETMLQLLQWRSLIKQAILRPLINANSKSKRYLDSLKEPPHYERSFVFGFYAPTMIYCLMIGMMFGFICPLMLGVCAIYFFIASKINTHNALFVYRQPYESGGTRFYYWSKMTIITCYCSIAIFAGMLVIKSFTALAIFFLLVMFFVVYLVDRAITCRFVIHSLELPIKLVAEEEVALVCESELPTQDEEATFMYRNPLLNQKTWQ